MSWRMDGGTEQQPVRDGFLMPRHARPSHVFFLRAARREALEPSTLRCWEHSKFQRATEIFFEENTRSLKMLASRTPLSYLCARPFPCVRSCALAWHGCKQQQLRSHRCRCGGDVLVFIITTAPASFPSPQVSTVVLSAPIQRS